MRNYVTVEVIKAHLSSFECKGPSRAKDLVEKY